MRWLAHFGGCSCPTIVSSRTCRNKATVPSRSRISHGSGTSTGREERLMSGVWTRLNLNVELNIGHNRIGLACSRIGPDRSVGVGTGIVPGI
jgi:hypothetical protein